MKEYICVILYVSSSQAKLFYNILGFEHDNFDLGKLY